MSSSDFFYAIGDFLTWTFGFFEWVSNKFNYLLLGLGFFGLFYWLFIQKKLSEKAAKNSNLIK
jgi:hypothetical protein